MGLARSQAVGSPSVSLSTDTTLRGDYSSFGVRCGGRTWLYLVIMCECVCAYVGAGILPPAELTVRGFVTADASHRSVQVQCSASASAAGPAPPSPAFARLGRPPGRQAGHRIASRHATVTRGGAGPQLAT